jgi:PTH1 family peptidyl-tRNA hydrolase
MNLSGNAVRYWVQKLNIQPENLIVVCDDLNLPFGTLRMRLDGSNGGHNGLGNIEQQLGTRQYARIRVGIGKEFHPGEQIDYVLSDFTPEEKELIPDLCKKVAEGIRTFATAGPQMAMNLLNIRKK